MRAMKRTTSLPLHLHMESTRWIDRGSCDGVVRRAAEEDRLKTVVATLVAMMSALALSLSAGCSTTRTANEVHGRTVYKSFASVDSKAFFTIAILEPTIG